MKSKLLKGLYILIILAVIVCRFASIWYVPDVYCDESDILNHISSLITNLTDAKGHRLPLFAKVGDGLTTYTYMYPMMVLGKMFGMTSLRARILQQCLTIIACFLTSLATYVLYNNKQLFKICLFVSLTMPWGFVQANRIWDPAFVPVYFSIYFLFFALLISEKYPNIYIKTLYMCLSYASLVLLAIVYPPCRIPAVAMWIFSVVWGIRDKIIRVYDFVVIFIVSSAVALPLAIYMTKPSFNKRTMSIIVFQGGDIKLELFQWLDNLANMIGPRFLFVSGDPNYRHCVPYWGVLGTLSIIPIVYGLRKKMDKTMIYMLFIFIVTSISVALTNEGLPHSLRACLSWLPASIFISYNWDKIIANSTKYKKIIWCCTLLLSFVIYFRTYIWYYSYLIATGV